MTGNDTEDRPELHNSSVDEEVAAEMGVCAQVHLQTGRTCLLERHHAGSCEFVPQEQVQETLDQHRAHQAQHNS